MLKLQNVYFSYKTESSTINNVSLHVKAGEFLAIVGRNGSGKTTLTRLMMTLRKPTSGEIFFQDQDTKEYSPAKMAQHIGYVFQNPDRQIFHDTVFEEAAYGPKQLGYSAEQIETFVNEALAVTGLSGRLSTAYPLSLSKGQKQRLTIASALAMQPKMLILDEPTSGQDARERDQLLQLLLKLNAQGMTILLVTHDMEFLSSCAKRAIVMAKGQKVFDGTISSLFEDTQLADWGLIEPTALKISRSLADLGIKPTSSIEQLGNEILALIGRDDHAKNSTHN